MPRSAYLKAGPWRADLERLHRAGLSDAAIARALSRLYPGQTFTHDRVRYWRTEEERLAQEGECVPRDGFDLHHRRAVHQLLRGFGHLLPLPLRRRESDILALLRERGPQTQRQLCEALGVRSLNTMGQRWLIRLRSLGLVEIVRWLATGRHPRALYGIAARALPTAGCSACG